MNQGIQSTLIKAFHMSNNDFRNYRIEPWQKKVQEGYSDDIAAALAFTEMTFHKNTVNANKNGDHNFVFVSHFKNVDRDIFVMIYDDINLLKLYGVIVDSQQNSAISFKELYVRKDE